MADEVELMRDDAGNMRLPVAQPSLLQPGDLYKKIKQWFLQDAAHSSEWRDRARKDFDFIAGDQWEPNDYQRMIKDEKRQPITFNKAAGFIDLVCGLEINGRHEVVYLPMGLSEGEILMNENLTQTSRWMAEKCDAEDNESHAFRDMLICGMGWTESRMDFECYADGMYVEEWIDPLEMYWDKAARKKNLADAQRIYRVRKMRLEDARALVDTFEGGEDIKDNELDAAWAIGVDTKAVKPFEDIRLKTGPGNAAGPDSPYEMDPNQEVHIVQVQWWERQPYYRVAHPQTGQMIELDDKTFKQLQKQVKAAGIKLTYVKQVKKVYKQAFLGGRLLNVGDAPCKDSFTLNCMTGEPNRSKGTWFGLTRKLEDPQRWANKLFSQVIHILNTTAKGGILAERGAFPDIREAQRTYARPDAITIVEDGAVQKGKIMQKPGVGLAAPFVQMMEYSDKAFYSVTNINIELMGMRATEQPGVLEAQRKQSGMTILARLFDARRHYLKQIGKVRLYFIQNFLADDRLMRVVSENGYKAIALTKDRVAGEYDVDVSEAPTSPDIKNQTWQMLMQLLPFFKDNMTPQIAGILLDTSPLPSEITSKLKQAVSQPPPGAEEQQQAQKMAQAADLAATHAKAENDAASASLKRAQEAKAYADAAIQILLAGGQLAQNQATAVEQALMQAMQTSVIKPITNVLPSGPYAVAPEGMGAPHQLPMPAELPRFGGMTPPNNMQELMGAQRAA